MNVKKTCCCKLGFLQLVENEIMKNKKHLSMIAVSMDQ